MVIGVAWTNEQQSTVRLGTRIYICTEERTAGRIAQPTSSFAWPWVLRLVDRARLPLQDNGRAQRAVARRKGCSIVSSRTNVYKFPSGVRGAAKRAPGRARGRLSRLFLWVDTNYTIIYMNMAPVASAAAGRNFKQRLAIRARGSERWPRVGASAHGGGGGRCCARGQ